ncbi:hypothetical protein C8J56DRAFT_909943 [Mycena floridula]|nr:hypothetical protein C8J56DRAFT_909943 [Mycena floridula]
MTDKNGSPSSGISIELVAEIISYHHDDKKNPLRLRPAAIVHLFQEIEIRRQSDFDIWREMAARIPELSQSIVKRFTYGRPLPLDPRITRQPIQPFRINPIPSVRFLTLWKKPETLDFYALFPNATRLKFIGDREWSFKNWVELLSHIGALEKPQIWLGLVDMVIKRSGSPKKLPKRVKCDLSELKEIYLEDGASMDRDYASGLEDLLQFYPFPSVPSWHVRPLPLLLQASGSSLEQLMVDPVAFAYFNLVQGHRGDRLSTEMARRIRNVGPFSSVRSLSLWAVSGSYNLLEFVENIKSSFPALTGFTMLAHLDEAVRGNGMLFEPMEHWRKLVMEILPKDFPGCRKLLSRDEMDTVNRFVCQRLDKDIGARISLRWGRRTGEPYADIPDECLRYSDLSAEATNPD